MRARLDTLAAGYLGIWILWQQQLSAAIFYFYMLRLKAQLLILTYTDKKKESRERKGAG